MNNVIFSLSTLLGTEVYSTKGMAIALLCDVVCNKDTGKITYFILCTGMQQEPESDPPEYFAVHHSFFYLSGEDEILTYSPKLGNDEHCFFLDLPEEYEDTEVQDIADFNSYLYTTASIAGHRSDND
ncbi:PRC-barrel domain-containing protein [Neolewinella litorea]|uniref:PRC-barrel domain containing protein n=1 Tax=Neolewinella litorea TaxID=2562452 RepID=A0A4S4NHX9_9BACT|nr:PRC-barrel domain-containing protein [Neolewinella litorea]THH39312.1 PRC-barrel domain containing protein [Neolewinella litorea]